MKIARYWSFIFFLSSWVLKLHNFLSSGRWVSVSFELSSFVLFMKTWITLQSSEGYSQPYQVFSRWFLQLMAVFMQVLLRSELIKSSSEERSLLKNLGSWLGKLTIGRNQALRAREVDPKALITEVGLKPHALCLLGASQCWLSIPVVSGNVTNSAHRFCLMVCPKFWTDYYIFMYTIQCCEVNR
jgi:hypothetical protein